tara:strand:- start:217 stop:1119 length:903 start_codon:yes stop_codon:yes gene_type:complete
MIENFYNWINERHAIYLARVRGDSPPWTEDPILREYKFTNPFRENDRTTVYMRKAWTEPNNNRPFGEIIFNCCLFRMVGTMEFAEVHGWVHADALEWDPEHTVNLISNRIKHGLKTFTGAYIITNQGIKKPKAEVVVYEFLVPIYQSQVKLGKLASETQSLQAVHNALSAYKGWGGGGFMSYEVVSDLNYTSVLDKATDRFSWANAGPGAMRGINRIHGYPLKKMHSQERANRFMQNILAEKHRYVDWDIIDHDDVDMRCIEHSLCEWDKYERVRLGQGKPRSKFKEVMQSIPKGPVNGD